MEEAAALTRGYYDEINAAIATGDVGDLEDLSAVGCSCRRLVGYIRDKWQSGSLRGGAFTVRSVEVLGVFPASADVLVRLSVAAYEVLDRSGGVVERVPAVPDAKETLKLAPNRTGEWLVLEIFGGTK